jgi:hypothetical protein
MVTALIENNKSTIEKATIMAKAYWKAQNDIMLYWHYQSCKEEVKDIIDNEIKNRF